jgi:hypothetical protein
LSEIIAPYLADATSYPGNVESPESVEQHPDSVLAYHQRATSFQPLHHQRNGCGEQPNARRQYAKHEMLVSKRELRGVQSVHPFRDRRKPAEHTNHAHASRRRVAIAPEIDQAAVGRRDG